MLAQRIVDWRTAHGRFTNVDELQEVSGIGEQRLEDLRPLVRVDEGDRRAACPAAGATWAAAWVTPVLPPVGTAVLIAVGTLSAVVAGGRGRYLVAASLLCAVAAACTAGMRVAAIRAGRWARWRRSVRSPASSSS